jgi:alpha-beta hydrolase superfamily lysophospholipase
LRELPAPRHLAIAGPGPRLAALHWPAPPDAPGVVVVHGYGSRKENHADFAERCAAAGMAALAIDLRGHGASGGRADAGMLDDVLAALAELRGRGHARLGLRGSSLGGFLALHAAARDPAVRAVVAVCPARPEGLARLLDADWPLARPLAPAVAREDGVARGYWHATGDDRVLWGATFALAGVTPQPMRLRIALGGSHRSLQHDPRVLAETAGFLAAHLG